VGDWVYYYPDGTTKKLEKYQDGKLNFNTSFDSLGRKQSEEPYLQNLLHGTAKTYYVQGSVSSETTYKLGKKTGSYTRYHQDGSTSTKGEYLKNQEIGVWEHYNEKGQLTKKTTFQRGKMVSEETF
jgi:antitoxin component YwqK of YwqJK toxin-antitoxin module